ncbi:MAG TPA: hypothetical protein EYP49_15830 [Anaerolineae bacterium]|nr:hypothetical protein [Anaerolineae bacterium]
MRYLYLIVLAGIVLLGASGCQAGPELAFAASTKAEELNKVANLRRDVQLLNLINGLDLSAEQMQFILDRAREAQAIREEITGQAEGNSAATSQVLSQLRETLMRGEVISSELRDEFFSVDRDNHALKEKWEQEIARLALEVEGNLEDHQLYALEHYVPCVIPPKGEARIGQAEDTHAGQALLQRIRDIPDDQFEARKEKIVQKVLERVLAYLPKDQALALDQEEETEWLLCFLEKVRGLDEMTFAVEKEALIEEIKSRYALPEVPVDVSATIERHLLDPRIIPLLEEKLAIKLEG